MRRQRWTGRLLFVGVLAAVFGSGCGRTSTATVAVGSPAVAPGAASTGVAPIDLPTADPRAGTAVVILVDTSGSMNQRVNDRGGKSRPKFLIARDALDRIIGLTGEW